MFKSPDSSDIENWNFPDKASLGPAAAVYDEMVMSAKHIYEKVSQGKELNIEDLSKLMERVINNVSMFEDKIIFLTSNIYLEDYLLYHTVNMIILSIEVGIHLKYPHQQIVDLGIFAILHGMDGAEGEGSSSRSLSRPNK